MPGMLQSMGSQRVGYDLATELNQKRPLHIIHSYIPNATEGYSFLKKEMVGGQNKRVSDPSHSAMGIT